MKNNSSNDFSECRLVLNVLVVKSIPAQGMTVPVWTRSIFAGDQMLCKIKKNSKDHSMLCNVV